MAAATLGQQQLTNIGDRMSGQTVDDSAIVRGAIYPGIGIARVGNSEHEYFFAPEVPEPLKENPLAFTVTIQVP